MRIHVECIPCFMRQARETASRVTSEEALQWKVMREVSRLVDGVTPDMCPPEFAERVYDTIAAVSGNGDPFAAEKHRANELALGLEPRLRAHLAITPDPLLAAAKFAIAGNSMDLGVVQEYGDVGRLADSMLAAPLGIDDCPALGEHLSRASHVLVIGDNNGEIVFDRLLIEQMQRVRPCSYTYMVRGRPVINDVTAEDAHAVGIDRIAAVVTNGSGAPGLVLSACAAESRNAFEGADLVVAKGQGNYESLSDAPRDVFFLLMVKCDVVSRALQAPRGVAVVKHHLAI